MLAVLAAVAFVLFAPSPGSCQQWETKRFQVVNVEPSGDVQEFGGFEIIVEAIVRVLRAGEPFDPDFPGIFETVEMEPGAALAIERFLGESAQLFESWGFPEPALHPVVSTEDGERAYRVYLVNRFPDDQHLDDAWSGRYEGSCNRVEERVILLDANSVLDGGRLTPAGAQTAAHELFHAIQGAAPFFECRPGEGGVGDWISEGQADAVGWDAFHILRGVQETDGEYKQWGGRSYHQELTVANFIQEEYMTSSFWRYLAEASVIASPGPEVNPVDYSFLARLYESPSVGRGCNGDNATCGAEIRWLDANLRQIFGVPLRELYARFLQALVEYGDHRPGLSRKPWQRMVLTTYEEIVLGTEKGDSQVVVHELPYFEENAAQCFEVEIRGVAGDARLGVRVDDPEKKLALEDLTAGLGGLPIQAYRARVEEGESARTASWTFALTGEGSTSVLLSNLADEPDKTTRLDGLPVTFTLEEEYAWMGPRQNVADTTSIVFSPVPIELDRLRRKALVPALTDAQAAAGFREPCAVRFYFSNSSTGDGVEISLDIERPLLPGTYDVALLDKGLFEPPEDHPGLAVVTFAIGKGNPLAQGDPQSYGGQSGTLQLDVVSADLVQGSLQVIGKRAVDGKWEAGGWRDSPTELETLAIESSFSLVPELPRGARGHLSLSDCVATDPTRRVIKKEKNEKPVPKPTPKPVPEDGDEQTQPGADAGLSSDPGEAEPADDQDSATASPHHAASEPNATVVPIECEPLLFDRSVVFSATPDLPFRFRHPEGWQHHADGSLEGRISPPSDPDAGLQYRVRTLSSPQEAAKAEGLKQAMWETIATIDYAGQPLEIYGGTLADVAHAYFIAPHGDDHLDVEVLFKGRRACDPALVENLRDLFVSSLAPAP